MIPPFPAEQLTYIRPGTTGTVFGNAERSNYFVADQKATTPFTVVGATNHQNIFSVFDTGGNMIRAYGGDERDTFFGATEQIGGRGNDRFSFSRDTKQAFGGDGNDEFTLNASALNGNRYISGGPGADHVYLPELSIRDALVEVWQNQHGTMLISGKGFQFHVDGSELVAFRDGALVRSGSEQIDFLLTLYKAAFGRAPDADGIRAWSQFMNRGNSPETVAESFMKSAEWKLRYGDATTPTDYVTKLYQNVLGRAPDAAGLQHWVDHMNNGMTQLEVLMHFVRSPENAAIVKAEVGNIAVLSGSGQYVVLPDNVKDHGPERASHDDYDYRSDYVDADAMSVIGQSSDYVDWNAA